MNDNIIALCVAAAFSVLICIIELEYHSKARFGIYSTQGASYFYLLILLVGNAATTLIAAANVGSNTEIQTISSSAIAAPPIVNKDTPDAKSLPASIGTEQRSFAPLITGYSWFWYAFLGVFGFEAILKNINITFFDKGVLSISDWISKARDHAVALAIDSKAQEDARRKQAITEKLRTLPIVDLNTHIENRLGRNRLDEIEQRAATQNLDASLLKALALAYEATDYAITIITKKLN